MNIDIDYKNSQIIETFPVEESMLSLVYTLDTRQMDNNINTFDIRSSVCAEVHSLIMLSIAQDKTYDDYKNCSDIIDEKRERDGVQIDEVDNRPSSVDLKTLNTLKNYHEERFTGLIHLLWVNFGCTHLSPLMYLSPKNRYGYGAKQKSIMAQAIKDSYRNKIKVATEALPSLTKGLWQQYEKEIQGHYATIRTGVDKLSQATAPAPKQYSMFEKQAYQKLDQANTTINNVKKVLDKGPVVIKEKVLA
tara:strand:- start:6164 stop:6907 length:744 start_codon:yes stop_codon:yes gene_type:complete